MKPQNKRPTHDNAKMVRAKRLLLVTGFIAAVLPFTLAGCDGWSKARVAETKRRGDIVRNALAQYRATTGSFPKELQELIPRYLDTIPQPTVGKKIWKYDVYANGQAYTISPEIRWRSEPLLQGDQRPGWTYDTK